MKPLLTACLLPALGLTLLGFAPRGEVRAVNPTVGIVDIARIQKECGRVKSLFAPLDAEAKKWDEKLGAISKEIREKSKAIENFEEGSAEFNDSVVKINVLRYRLNELKKLANLQGRKQRSTCLFQLYREIEKSVQEIAKARGLQIVFKFSSSFRNSKVFSVNQRLNLRESEHILFFDQKLDITSDVIKLMDSER